MFMGSNKHLAFVVGLFSQKPVQTILGGNLHWLLIFNFNFYTITVFWLGS
jgi:hypothetical protein